MPSVVLSGLKAIADKVGGPAGYLGKAVLGVLENVVNDFDALKDRMQQVEQRLEQLEQTVQLEKKL
jgi:hypothetical protein